MLVSCAQLCIYTTVDSLIVIIFVIGSFYCLASRLVLAAVPVVTVGAEKRDWLIEPSGFG